MPTLEELVAEAEASAAACKARRDATDREAEMQMRLATAQQVVRDAPAIEAAVADHGPIGIKIAVVDTRLGAVIVKAPHPAVFKRFIDTGSMKAADLDRLVRPCLVYPDVAAFDRILDELPGTLHALADAVCVLAGVRAKEVGGK